MHDIISFDMELGNTLQELQGLVFRKQYLNSIGGYNPEELRFRGALIEDLCLDFSLPGYPDYVLKPGNDIVSNKLSFGFFYYLLLRFTFLDFVCLLYTGGCKQFGGIYFTCD